MPSPWLEFALDWNKGWIADILILDFILGLASSHGLPLHIAGRVGAGTLFGLAVAPNGSGVYFVDDGNNTLNILQ
jgi:hypothetical protein